MTNEQLDQLSINTIRTLSIDAVQQANSGHPGTPMARRLWSIRSGSCPALDPEDPIWPDRDRFVLSNGHASMLLWSVLHLTGTKAVNAAYERLGQPAVSLDDIRRFRQLGSKAPGHPEYHWVSGVETTTGPLGQGVATSVGMAMAQKWLAQRYNRPGFDIFDYRIYAVCGDGCLMEGVASEAASLAGHLAWTISAGSPTTTTSPSKATHASPSRRTSRPAFSGYGWNILRVGDANDIDRIEHALDIFHKTKGVRLSSFWTATSATARRINRTLRRRTASPWARKRFALSNAPTGGPRTRSSSFPTPCASISPPESAGAGRRPTGVGLSCSRLIARNIRGSRPRSS